MFEVTTAASSPALLTPEQLRVAAGLAADDESQDDALADVGLRVAAEISAACDIAIAVGAVPTLLRETLTETFRNVSRDKLVLSRRHDVAINSIAVDGTALETAEYEVDGEAGLLSRLSGDVPVSWCGSKIVVVYQAGFATVPADLSGAANDLVQLRLSESTRDPLLKSEQINIPDVRDQRRDYWVGALGGARSGGGIPDHIAGRLARFMNVSVA